MNWCPITDNTGNTVGRYGLSELTNHGERYFEQIYVESEYRGMGYASNHYAAIAAELATNGEVLISDPVSFSTGALGVCLSLEKQGLAKKEGVPIITELGDVYGVSFRATVTDSLAA